MNKYVFSGHESFPCKTLWLKKGYDFVVQGKNFNNPDAVIDLGMTSLFKGRTLITLTPLSI